MLLGWDMEECATRGVDDQSVAGLERRREFWRHHTDPVTAEHDALAWFEIAEWLADHGLTVAGAGICAWGSHGAPAYARGMAPPNDSASGTDDTLYFRQFLSGQDFATRDQMAVQMVNFVYAIGDRSAGECVLVDPAYDPSGLIDLLAADGMTVTGVLATHYHADHIGGDIMGHNIVGVSDLLEQVSCPVHVQADEVPWVSRTSGVSGNDLVSHRSGDVIMVGDVEIELIHTPGHTPGSQCFLVDRRLVAGDTLFLDGCGRTDLPGSDHAQMIESLRRLSTFDDDIMLFPGHRYSPAPSAPMGVVKSSNYVFDAIVGN